MLVHSFMVETGYGVFSRLCDIRKRLSPFQSVLLLLFFFLIVCLLFAKLQEPFSHKYVPDLAAAMQACCGAGNRRLLFVALPNLPFTLVATAWCTDVVRSTTLSQRGVDYVHCLSWHFT